ncbi:TPA: Nif3-like dinuclear metal center hexameric protein [bacterium]|jgi:dinuclear metal center YbgI/SA1388 family protein|nr:Nif3-like dinuclear metal center hexameric protein [bacterium]
MKSRTFLSLLGRKYPKRLTFIKDRLGLCGAKLPTEIDKVVISLDCDEEAINLALSNNVKLIISHHPLLYPNKRIALKEPMIKKIYDKLIENDLSCYSIHTNFDLSSNGMNANFGKMLGLINIKPFNPTQSFLYTGELEKEMEFNDFINMFKEKLGLDYVLYQDGKNGASTIKKVGFILGSGTSEYMDALISNCDVFISGDSKHHIRRYMYHQGLNFIELMHEYEQEIFISVMNDVVKDIDSNMQILLSYSQKHHKLF